MEFFVEHPYWSYLLISLVFGAWCAARINPRQLKIRAENTRKFAEALEKANHKLQVVVDLPIEFPLFMMGPLWIVLIPCGAFNTLYRWVFGSSPVPDSELELDI